MIPIFYCDQFLDHKTGLGHPECPERLVAVVKHLQQGPLAQHLRWESPNLPQDTVLHWIGQVHGASYIEQVKALAQRGGGPLDPDTFLSSGSYGAAWLAVNAWLESVNTVVAHHQPAFALARPPGHHALPNQGMGFCIFANAAIAALYALAQPGIERVAILDWDVHHGNGTQAIVAHHPQIAYCSLHQYPFYPGTGAAQETGPHQTLLNIPMSVGSKFAEYEAKFQAQVLPFLKTFNPDLLIVSAGYDANQDDPLAGIQLQPQDYGHLTTHCLSVTRKIVFGLEGGYDLNSLSASVAATLAACLRGA